VRDLEQGQDKPQRFENKTQVTAMFKRALEPDDMLLVVWVILSQLVEDLDFLLTGFIPVHS
jgi:hypothetical protein